MKFKQRIGIITGASAGFGRDLALDLLKGGAKLVLNARREEPLREIQKLFPDQVSIVVGDAGDDEVINNLFAKCISDFGANPNLVVPNAGRGYKSRIIEPLTDQFEEILNLNVVAVAKLVQKAGAMFLKDIGDKKLDQLDHPYDIVFLSSVVGYHYSHISAYYTVTKHALSALAETLRRDICKSGVRVTTIYPGFAHTEFQKAGGYPADNIVTVEDKIGPILQSQDVVDTITFALSLPKHVNISDLVVRPVRSDYP